MLREYSAERGQTGNSIDINQALRSGQFMQMAKNATCELVYVDSYDPMNQTVDVVLANDKRSQPIRAIPIAGTGGNGVRFIRSLKGKESATPDIGIIIFARLGGGRKFIDFVRRDTKNLHAAIERTAIFFGGIPAAISAGEIRTGNLVATNPLLHQIGKEDNGIVKPSGAGFMVKENDDLVLRGRHIYFLGLDQTEANVNPVAITGGDVTPTTDLVSSG